MLTCCLAAAALALRLLAAAQNAPQTSTPPVRQSLAAEILLSCSLTPDGKGKYVDRKDGVLVFGLNAITICTDQRTCNTLPQKNEPPTPALRSLLLDLGSPVVGSGAENLGVVRAHSANFGAWWEQDTSGRRTLIKGGREGPGIRSALALPVGRTIESERIGVRFFMNGVQHMLQFGPWTAGQYQTTQGLYYGEGTTRGTMTRVSETTWRVRSGTKSIGRLWDNRDPSHPKDLGLYQFTYDVQFDRN